MNYILRLKSDNSRVDSIPSKSIEEATEYFIKRKQMDKKTFNNLYEVKKDETYT
jgi:phosphoribosyl-ATP pyrophosphohydrolase